MKNITEYNYGSRGAVVGESTAIEFVAIDKSNHEIGIVFHFTPGVMYIWTAVKDDIIEEFEDTASLGTTFNNLLRSVAYDHTEKVVKNG